MKLINEDLLSSVSKLAEDNPRKRMNYNFHSSGEELLQRMLNALEPGTYLSPHRHTDNVEIFLLIKGRIQVLLFDDQGDIRSVQLLDPKQGNYGVEIPAGVWHTILVEEKGSVIYEIKQGPYIPNKGIEFAPWAPDVNDTIACEEYLQKLRIKI